MSPSQHHTSHPSQSPISISPMCPSVAPQPAPSQQAQRQQASPQPAPLQTPPINTAPVQNRIFGVMMHTTRYAFKAQARLSRDCGVAPSTICRLLTGQSSPSFALVAVITASLEKQLKRPLDPRELVSTDGRFATVSTCVLCGCRGCLPDEAYDENERIRPEYQGVKPGEWTTLSRRFVRQALNEESAKEVR